MDVVLTPEQQQLRETVARIVQRHATLPQLADWDQSGAYPREFFATLAAAGLFGMPFPANLGGGGGGAIEMVLVGEELGKASIDLAAGFGIPIFAGLNVARFGTPGQQERYLVPVIKGEGRFAIALSEPEAGSDARAITTRLERDGDNFHVTGVKLWSTGAGLPETVLHVSARAPHADGKVALILVPINAKGVECRRLGMVGRHMLGTYEITLDRVKIEGDALLGRIEDGWKVITSGLAVERLFGASSYLGGAQSALDMAISYSLERTQFGRTIGSFQAIAHRLADLHVRVLAGRSLVYTLAASFSAGDESASSASAAKLYCSELFQDACDEAMQVFGAYGYSKEYPIERLWRDARSATVAGGTSEIQRTIIARSLGLG